MKQLITLTLSEVKGNEEKKCFYCGSGITKKYGFVRRIQRSNVWSADGNLSVESDW